MKRPIFMIVLLLLLLNAASIYWFTQRSSVPVGAATEAPPATPNGVVRLELLTEAAPGALIPVAAMPVPDEPPKDAPVTLDVSPATAEAVASPDDPRGSPPVAVSPARLPACFVTHPCATNASDDSVLRTLAHIPDVAVNATVPEVVTESTTYWVRLKGYRAPKDSMAVVKELHDKGLKDVAAPPVQGPETVGSLGS